MEENKKVPIKGQGYQIVFGEQNNLFLTKKMKEKQEEINMWTKKEEVGVMGEWMERSGYFWYGANGCEFIAWKGSHQIFVYPCDDYPKPPSEVIQSTNRIETVEDFSNTLMNGHTYQVTYK